MNKLNIHIRENHTLKNVQGALVVLDGKIKQTSNSQGIVCIPLPRGIDKQYTHEILVFRGFDYKPFILSIPNGNLHSDEIINIELEIQPRLPADGITYGIEAIGAAAPVSVEMDNISIAMLDTGIDANHPCLNVLRSYQCYSQIETVNQLPHTTKRPVSPHGTFSAGIIGAKRYRNHGIFGVAPGVSLIDLRVFDPGGRYASKEAICRAVQWAIKEEVHILHIGFGSIHADPKEEKVFNEAREAGVLVVAPAGNTGNHEKKVMYPAAYESVICVGAIGRISDVPKNGKPEISSDGQWFLPSFSRRGKEVDFVAPGVGIFSIVPGFPGGKVLHDFCSGTSEAACFVSGALARLMAEHPGADKLPKKDRPKWAINILNNEALDLNIKNTGAGLIKVWKPDKK